MDKQDIVTRFRRSDSDTGSPEVQVALLTYRIQDLTRHLDTHKKDESTRFGLLKLVGQRRRLLRYLSSKDVSRYQALISELKLRK